MKLIELSPHWLTPDIFIFKNPTGGPDWLTCKHVLWPEKQYHFLACRLRELNLSIEEGAIVGIEKDYCWKFEGNDFNTLTVTPSIDASKSGNWHGYITNGEIK